MKKQQIYSLTAAIVIVFAGLYSPGVRAEKDKTLKSEFERVADSFFGGEMIFSCGYGTTSTFKITYGIFSKPALYWKSGIEWQQLTEATFKDTGVIFDGLGRKGGVPLNELEIGVEIPIFDSRSTYDRKAAKEYFVKSQETELVPFEYTFDTIQGSLTSTNLYPITDRVQLNVEKYTIEQSRPPMSFAFSAEQRAEEERKKKERSDAIDAVVARFSDEMEVVTPARRYTATEYCRLEE